MGLTNNEVKFLVTLDIDEDKSKKKIDGFLDKTIKDQKITFDVAVGKSEHNINEFLKKHKEKKASILFDVAVGKSNKNISDFLAKRTQDTQSLVFYVNEGATKSKINATLATMKFNNALIELGVKKTESLTNINNFIDNAKTHKKNIELDVNDASGFTSINNKIDAKQLNKAKLSFMMAQGAFDGVNETLKNKVFTGVKFVGQLDVEATQLKIQQQINKMKLPKLTVDVEPVVAPIVQATQKQKAKQQNTATETPSTDNDDVLIGSQKKVFKKLKQEYKDLGQTVELFNKNRAEGEESFVQALKRQGKQVDIIRDAQTNEITKITSTFKNSSNEIQKDVFVPIIRKFKETKNAGAESVKEIRGFVNEISKIKNTERFNLPKEIEDFNRKLNEARHTATITAKALRDFKRDAQNATSRNQIDELNDRLKVHQAEQRKRNQLEREQINLIGQQEQLMANLIRIEKMYLKTVKKEEADAIRANINAIKEMQALTASGKGLYRLNMGDMAEAREQIINVRGQIKNLNAEATEASKNSMGIISSLKTAFEKFPIWMIASTAFYGSMRTLQTFGEVIIDVDKKMTDLKKVMSDDTDFGKVFEDATKSAETFGKTISESLDAYVMFAKQGFKGDELADLSNAAIVAGNVGDIEAGKASEYMIASMLQWDKDSTQAMSVVDSWNEISNNFATTVENLAQGQAKAGATARALGMDFDQLNAVVGTLNARTKQSGNEIGNFVKSTFANLVSNKGRSTLADLGVALEDGEGNMRDVMEIYKDVAKEYVKLNQADKNSVTLGLAGKYHISRMQTLLDDLGSANSMYEEMYDTSKNSANSAMDENAKYMQSLEAKINLAKVEIEKLSLAIGEAFLSDGMVTGLQVFSTMLSFMTELVKATGALPVALLAGVTALTLFSNRFSGIIKNVPKFKELGANVKNFATNAETNTSPSPTQSTSPRTVVLPTKSVDRDTEATNRNTTAVVNNERKRVKLNREISNTKVRYEGALPAQNRVIVATNNDTRATDRNTESKKKASKAMSLFTSGFTLWGLGAIGVGVGLEFLLGKIGDARRKQEELKNQTEQTMASFKTNENAVISLAQRYDELSGKKLDPNTEEYAELLEVQNKLAEILPDLKTGEDAYGNAILVNSEYVNDRVQLLKDQLEIEEKLAKVKANEEQEEAVNEAKKKYSKSKKEVDGGLQDADSAFHVGADYDNFNYGERYNLAKKIDVLPKGAIQDAEELMKIINEIDNKVNDMEFIKKENLSDGDIATLKTLRSELYSTFQAVNSSSLEMNSNLSVIKSNAKANISSIISNTESLSAEAKKSFSEFSQSALAMANDVSDIDNIEDALSSLTINPDAVKSLQEFNDVTEKVSKDSSQDAETLAKTYGSSFKTIREAILKKSGFDSNSSEYKALETALMKAENAQYKYQVSVAQVAKEQNISIEDAKAYVDKLAETGDVAEDSAESLYKLESAIEQLTGVSSQQIEDTDELLFVYDMLSARTNLTAKETETLTKTMESLGKIYPYLNENGELRIDSIRLENEVTKDLQEAYELAKDGILTAEEQRTVDQQQEIYTRMKNLQVEAEAIGKIQEAYNKTKKISSQMFVDLVEMGAIPESKTSFWIPGQKDTLTENDLGDIISNQAKKVKDEIGSLMGSLKSNSSKVSSINSKASKRAKEEAKAQAKEVDRVKEVTDKYALSLEKLKTQLDAVSSRKSKFAKHSDGYRKALLEENALIQKQIELITKQAQELGGSISVTSNKVSGTYQNASYSTTSSKQLSGWNHSITSGYGAKESFRKSAHTGVDIDGYLGERLDANVAGKVIATGKNALSGNYVKIRDNNGYEHFYGHLNKITAKLDQIVKVGDQIGEIGNTGNVYSSTGDGSHLHYEIKLNGKNVDPTSFAKGAMTINVNTGTTTSGTTTSKASGSSAQAKTWNFFKGKGLSDSAVAGIMGNIQQESNFNSSAVNKSSGATGIFQWLGSRLKELKAYAKNKGTSYTDLQTQLEFAWKELQSTEKKSLSSLQKNLSATQHASEFERLFERSGGSAVGKRQNYASNWYNQYAGKNVSSGSSSNGSIGDVASVYNSVIGSGGTDTEAQMAVLGYIQQVQDLVDTQIANAFEAKVVELEKFSYKKKTFEDIIAQQEAVKSGLQTTSDAWEQAVNKQVSAQKQVKKAVNDELWLTNEYLKKNNLTDDQRYQLIDRKAELETALKEAGNSIKEFYSQVVQGRLDRFDTSRAKYQKEIDWEDVKIQSVDPSSERYVKTLERANLYRGKLLTNIKEEQKYIDKQLASGQLSVEMYNTLVERAKELKNEVIETTLALQQTNYDTIQAILNPRNEKIDDHDFKLERSVAIQNLYEEGSADQLRELNFQLDEHKAKLAEIDSIETDIQNKMKNLDLSHQHLADLEEQLEANTMAWYDTKEAIQQTEEAIKEFNKEIDETLKEKRESIADEIIDALKDAYEEMRDIKIKAIDDEIEAEDKRHEKVMKNYQDELDMFNDIIDAKRREINDADRDRTHDNNIKDLEDEMAELVKRKTAISGINTFDAKKEREELDKQIKEKQKQIDEEYYQYSKELQLQALDDELEERSNFIEEKQEEEDEAYEKNIERLNDEKEYWNKYYDDLINDEREWQRLRDALTKGTNEQIKAEMNKLQANIQGHIETLKASLPDLEDTLNGTMDAVGTKIRDSVIFELENLIDTMKKVQDEVDEIVNKRDSISGDYGHSIRDDKPLNNLNDENGKLKEADLKVIMAKFMNEQIAGKLDANTSATRIKNIKDRATTLAEKGRAEGSKLSAGNHSLSDIMSTLSQDQLKQVGEYFQNNADVSEFDTQLYKDYIKDYGKDVFSKGQSLSEGDKTVLLGKFINRNLVAQTNDKTLQTTLEKLGSSLGKEGRNDVTVVSDTVSFDNQFNKLTQPQKEELANFMLSKSHLVADGALRTYLETFAERMKMANTNDYIDPSKSAKLDSGGYTGTWGSSGGVDGKGGKFAVLHQREIVLNPIDTQRMFNVSSLMENIMSRIGHIVSLPNLVKPTNTSNTSSSDNSTTVNIHIDKMTGKQSDIENLSNQIANKLLREKGKR